MRRKRRQHRCTGTGARKPAKPAGRRSLLIIARLVIVAGALALVVAIATNSRQRPVVEQVAGAGPVPAQAARHIHSLDDLLKMAPEELAKVDIAEMSLLCAANLPGSENLNIEQCLARLDLWAARVKAETERHLYRVHDPKWAEHYKHSEKWLRAEFLAQVLNEDCGVHYNMERVRNIDFRNAKDLFIHGMIDNANGGTCASMPVLYVAVGRRLGYPLKLVDTKGHLFVRWDDGKEQFNIEVTSNGGTDSHPDDYYRSWPERLTDAEVKANRYLVSLSAAEELADCLSNRGHCLLDNGRAREALDAYSAAHRLAPQNPKYMSWVRQAQRKLAPPGYARMNPDVLPMPSQARRRIDAGVEAINAYNRRR